MLRSLHTKVTIMKIHRNGLPAIQHLAMIIGREGFLHE